MTADTVHLLAQFVRMHRGMATALEKWTRAQPPSAMGRELTEIIGVYRGVLATYEAQLSKVDVVGVEQ